MGKQDRISDEDLSMLDRGNRTEVKRLQKLLKSATSKGNLSEQSKLCNTLGDILAESGLLNLALQYHTQDLEISEGNSKPLDIAVAHRKVGEVFAELGEFDAAVSHQEQYMKISEELGDLIEQQRAHATLGRTFYTHLMADIHDEDKAADVAELRKKSGQHYISALRLTDTLRTKRLSTEKEIMEMKARLHLNIGLLYDKVNPDLSTTYLLKALREAERNRDSAIQHLALLQLCESHLLKGDTSQAILYGEQAVKASKSGDNENEKFASNEMLALAHLHSKNILEARRCAKEALQLNSDLDTAMTVYKVTKLIMSTQQVDFGESEREVGILCKITNILMKLSLYAQAPTWLQKELKLSKHCGVPAETVADIHDKLGECYKELCDYKLSLYHYTQLISLLPSATAWTNIALVSLKDDQTYQDCYDAVQAGISEARSPHDKSLCLNTLIEIAEHFDKQEVVDTAKIELSKIEEDSPDSCSLSQDTWNISDVEISESESETVDEESETNAVRGKRNTKLTKVNEKGETPLHQACIEGKADKVRELLGKHATPNTRDHAGWTPLHEACNHGYLEIVQLLVAAGAHVNDRGGKECGGITPLHDAAQWGNFFIVKHLVENGANILARDDEGRSALQLAENIIENDPEDVNNENRQQIKRYLTEVSKNPPKPRKPLPSASVAPKNTDHEELFTTGSNSSFLSSQLPRSVVHVSNKENVASHRSRSVRVSDSVLLSRKQTNKGPRPLNQRSSEPTSAKHRIVDDWLVEDNASPKRKLPHDPFLPKSSDRKRSKQTKLSASRIKIEDNDSSPELPPIVALPATQTVPPIVTDHPKIRVKIKIRDTLFFLPVKPNQTIADLALDAAGRYRSKVGILPTLSLTTSDGAELDSEDVATQLLVEGDELVGVIEEAEHVGMLEKYVETCERVSVEPVLKDVFAGSVTSISISRFMASHKQLECFFTTILCCTTMTKLDVSFNKLSKDVLTTFCSVVPTLTALSDINISGCGLNNTNFLKMSDCLSKLPLQILKLDNNAISHCFTALLELLVSISSLSSVSALGCTLTTSAAASPELSEKLSNSNITSLNLSQNYITHFPIFPKRLKSLTLGGSNIENTGLKLPQTLEFLCLENCSLNDTNFREILSDLRNITTFRAPFNHITGECVVDLVMLFPRITVLDLSSNPVGEDGVETLSLVAPPTLTLQNCRAGGVTPDIITALHGSVQECDLSYNKIDYPSFCKELSDDIRDSVICQGNKLIIRGSAGSDIPR